MDCNTCPYLQYLTQVISNLRFWALSEIVSFPLQVKYWRKSEDSEASAHRVVVSSQENQTRLEGMKPYSHYLIEVRAYNAAGYGPPCQHFQIYTKKARTFITLSLMVIGVS